MRVAIFGQECRRTDNINNFLFWFISSFFFFLPLSHPRIWLLPFIVLQLKFQVIKIIDWQYWVRRVGVPNSLVSCFEKYPGEEEGETYLAWQGGRCDKPANIRLSQREHTRTNPTSPEDYTATSGEISGSIKESWSLYLTSLMFSWNILNVGN